MLSVDKIHKCKRYSLSTRTKTGFEYIFTENIYEISLCWEECLCDVSPMIIQGAWTRPMPGQPEENLLKSFSQTIYLQLCISTIHWNKYHVIYLYRGGVGSHLERCTLVMGGLPPPCGWWAHGTFLQTDKHLHLSKSCPPLLMVCFFVLARMVCVCVLKCTSLLNIAKA